MDIKFTDTEILPENIMKTPQYFIVGDRPVRFIRTEEDRLTCQAYQWKTGEFKRDMSYLTRCTQGEGDIDEVSEAEFEAKVKSLRQKLAEK